LATVCPLRRILKEYGMSKNSNSRAAPPPRKGGSSMVAAVLVGMVLGLALAGGVAWYILKRPNPFVNNAPHETVRLEPDPVKPPPVAAVAKPAPEVVSAVAAASGVAASGVGESKPRFEFYKVLTDKPDAAVPAKVAAKQTDKAVAKETYFLQAGAFSNVDDADKLKAKLAMLGMEASVQAATLPDKTVWHRVRLGPYKSSDEMSKASAVLKQNGVNATPMRAQ
jgi:cell division protein FtsN